LRVDPVLRHAVGQREHVSSNGRRLHCHEVHVAVVSVDDADRVLPGHRLGDQLLARFEPEPQGVIGDDAARVRVVRRHGRLARADQVGVDNPAGGKRPEPPPDPRRKLRRRFAGEREPQHLLRPDEFVCHQPDDPAGHRLGLAGTGTRDH
jgi:hypothetical protein